MEAGSKCAKIVIRSATAHATLKGSAGGAGGPFGNVMRCRNTNGIECEVGWIMDLSERLREALQLNLGGSGGGGGGNGGSNGSNGSNGALATQQHQQQQQSREDQASEASTVNPDGNHPEPSAQRAGAGESRDDGEGEGDADADEDDTQRGGGQR